MPLTSAGYQARTADDWLAIIRQAVDDRRAALDLDPATYADTTLHGVLTQAVALQLGSLDEAVQAIYDQRSPSNAVGANLDDLLSLTGLSRRLSATYSTVRLGFFGTLGTFVPAGTVIRDANRQDWITVEDGEVTNLGSAVSVRARAVNAGAITAAVGTVNVMTAAITGVTGVTNGEAAVPGREIESDAAVRQRIKDFQALGGSDTTQVMRAGCLLVPDVQQVEVLTNRTSESVVQYGYTLTPHSLAVFVYPPNIAAETQLADTILSLTPAGIELLGDESATRFIPLTDPPEPFTVRWNYQSEVAVDVDVELTLETGYTLAQVTDAVTAAVADYQLALLREPSQARTVYRLQILRRIGAIDGIASAEVTLDAAAADVTLNAINYPTLNVNSVTEA